MLTPDAQGGHLSLTFSFVWLIVVSNIITTAVAFLFLGKIARITQVRTSLVIPFILILSYVGAFAENNAFGDILVMLAFGALGWIMVHLDWPRPPLILGLVLGKLMERYLFLSVDNYGLDWLRFPSVIALFSLMVLGVGYPLFQKWRKRRGLAGTAGTQAKEVLDPAPLSIWMPVFTLFTLFLFAWALWQAHDWEFRPRLFPFVVGFLGLALAFIQLNFEVVGTIKAIRRGTLKAGDQESMRLARETAKITAWILSYLVAIWLLGFSLSIIIMTFMYLVLARERLFISLSLAFFAWITFYVLFVYLLHMPFPEGQLFAWLL